MFSPLHWPFWPYRNIMGVPFLAASSLPHASGCGRTSVWLGRPCGNFTSASTVAVHVPQGREGSPFILLCYSKKLAHLFSNNLVVTVCNKLLYCEKLVCDPSCVSNCPLQIGFSVCLSSFWVTTDRLCLQCFVSAGKWTVFWSNSTPELVYKRCVQSHIQQLKFSVGPLISAGKCKFTSWEVWPGNMYVILFSQKAIYVCSLLLTVYRGCWVSPLKSACWQL